MNDLEARLTRCFSVIFPELDEAAIRRATADNVADWDSVATVTLINVIEEEFGIRIDVDAIEEMVSFDAALRYLKPRVRQQVA